MIRKIVPFAVSMVLIGGGISMIKVENKSRKEIADIGRRIGEAFADEKAGTVTMLTREQTIKSFEIMTEWFYRAGTLYTTSEIGEGYSEHEECCSDDKYA